MLGCDPRPVSHKDELLNTAGTSVITPLILADFIEFLFYLYSLGKYG
jgi:hypothetical protein